jgi:hypothetical protein
MKRQNNFLYKLSYLQSPAVCGAFLLNIFTMRANIFTCLGAIILLTSCSGHTKKIIVYANSNAQISEETKTVVNKDNTGHLDQTLTYSTGDKVTLKVTFMDGKTAAIDFPESGYYIANAKAQDTIVGGFQKYATPEQANRVMTQEELKHNIDSLKQMVTGANTNAANRTYFILPGTAAKVTENTKAEIVGPYHRMTSIAKTGDEEPEVYRFYSISEVRETIGKLEKLTGPAAPAGQPVK